MNIDDEYLQGALLERVQFLESHREMDVVSEWVVCKKKWKNLFIYDECEKNIQDVLRHYWKGRQIIGLEVIWLECLPLFKFYPEREIYQSKIWTKFTTVIAIALQ